MRAMVLNRIGQPLLMSDVPEPRPRAGQILLRVNACGVCRTDLHVVDGDLRSPKLPLIPGHQIVGTVATGGGNLAEGARVGVPWLGGTCGKCPPCAAGRENLCESATYTGYQIDGGFAEMCVADERYCFPLPSGYPDLEAAPLLGAGLIGYRALRMTGDAKILWVYVFGSAANILLHVERHHERTVFAFTRAGDAESQTFARELGAEWSGPSEAPPPRPLDAAIIFAPAGDLVPVALKAVAPGGTVVCAGIHMSDIPSFPYSILWEERSIRSVANLTRQDGVEFLELAPKVPVKTEVAAYPLEKANEALEDLRSGRIRGSAVLSMVHSRGDRARPSLRG